VKEDQLKPVIMDTSIDMVHTNNTSMDMVDSTRRMDMADSLRRTDIDNSMDTESTVMKSSATA
jgi:hypothetical protein